MYRVACVWIPHFVTEVERQRLGTQTRPLLVCDGTRVLGTCAQASALDVREGDPLHQALTRCPDAQVIQGDRTLYQEVWERILEALGQHSPLVEEEAWGMAYLDAGGTSALYGSEMSWCQAVCQEVRQSARMQAQLGVAGSKFTAQVAARSCPSSSSYQIVSQDDRSYLSSLPVSWLPLSAETHRRLHLLGIRTIGRFASLPAPAIAEQFGTQNLQAHRWARGKDNRPLVGHSPRIWEAHLEFQVPETRREPLLAALVAASRQALDDLKRGLLAVQRIYVRVRLFGGEMLERSTWIGNMLGPRKLRTVLKNLLDSLKGDDLGIVEIWIKLIGLKPWGGRQLSLFAQQESHLRLEETLRKLAQKHSPGCVARVCIADPDALLVGNQYRLAGYGQ